MLSCVPASEAGRDDVRKQQSRQKITGQVVASNSACVCSHESSCLRVRMPIGICICIWSMVCLWYMVYVYVCMHACMYVPMSLRKFVFDAKVFVHPYRGCVCVCVSLLKQAWECYTKIQHAIKDAGVIMHAASVRSECILHMHTHMTLQAYIAESSHMMSENGVQHKHLQVQLEHTRLSYHV